MREVLSSPATFSSLLPFSIREQVKVMPKVQSYLNKIKLSLEITGGTLPDIVRVEIANPITPMNGTGLKIGDIKNKQKRYLNLSYCLIN